MLPRKMGCEYVIWLLLDVQARGQRTKSETNSKKQQSEDKKDSREKIVDKNVKNKY